MKLTAENAKPAENKLKIKLCELGGLCGKKGTNLFHTSQPSSQGIQ